MVHCGVYLNKYVVSNQHSGTVWRSLQLPALIALKILRKLLFFACFRFLIFHPFSRGGGSVDPIVRTPMTVAYMMSCVCLCVCLSVTSRSL